MLKDITPRAYQQNIFESAKKKNSLVILPTGMGKSLIGLMLAIHRMEKYPESKILVLAPTRPLVSQWQEYFSKHSSLENMQLFTGKVHAKKREELWEKSDVVFSTPQCVMNDLKKGIYSLQHVSLLIEDECHRCIKNYAYTFVASEYIKQAKNSLLLGLTASPGSDAKTINEICKNLSIENIEARTRESEDVKSYLQKLNIEVVKLELPEEFKKVKELLEDIYEKRIEELKKRKLLFTAATKKNLIELQGRIMRAIASGNKHFNLLRGASICAQTIKLQHTLELLETQGIEILYNYMQELLKQAELKKSKAVMQLVKQNEFITAMKEIEELIAKNIEHPKLAELKRIAENEIAANPKLKMIVFSQYRETVTKICKTLNSIQGIRARVFIGQARKGESEAERGLTQQEQQEIIKDFSLGKINILSASSIGEEGLDLPEVNVVIFYEPIPSAIRKIQRIGRTARLKAGKVIILLTKKTRDESYYWAAFHKEKKMHGIIQNMQEKFQNQKKQLNLKDFEE